MKKNNFKIIELKPRKNKNTIKRGVFIKDFIIQEIIGIHEHEKIKKQKIKFNIFIDVEQNAVPNEKDIKSIIDYEKITNKLENLAKSKKYNFLESLAEDSFGEIFDDKRVARLSYISAYQSFMDHINSKADLPGAPAEEDVN